MKAHNFLSYWRSLSTEEKDRLAKDCGVKRNYLSQIAGGHKYATDRMVRALTDARKDIRQVWFL